MKEKKKIIIIITCVVMVVTAGLLYRWYIPYFHPVIGWAQIAGYRYYIKDDIIVLTEYTGSKKVVHIPERLKGRKVVAVGGYCFANKDVEEVYVPATVEIENNAFFDCKTLKKVQGSSNRIIYNNIFRGAENLEEALFGNKIEEVESGAFRDCIKFKSIDFLKDVEYLGSQAFWGTAIEELPSMENLEYVGNDVFWETPWEEKQEGDFVIVGNTLQLYKGSDQVVHIPEGITAIRTAFLYREEYEYPIQVKEVYIPDTVKTLGDDAFLNQEDLTVYIPASVREIGIDSNGKTHEMEGNIKIVTTAGSYAEKYAKKYGVEYEIVDGWD